MTVRRYGPLTETVGTVLDYGPRQSIEMPIAAELLYVGQYDGELAIWARVDDDAETALRVLSIYMTGDRMAETHERYVGSAVLRGTPLHVFDLGEHGEGYVRHYL